jgi:hypothetical protein
MTTITTTTVMPVKTEQNLPEPTLTLALTRAEVAQLLETLVISREVTPEPLIARLADVYRAFSR